MSEAIHEPVVPKAAFSPRRPGAVFARRRDHGRLTGDRRRPHDAAGRGGKPRSAVRGRQERRGAGVRRRRPRLVDTLAPGSNGFIRVVLRGLARERKLGDIGPQPPFRLTRFVNGQITLTDTSTGKQIDLDAFGSTNAEAFARLMN